MLNTSASSCDRTSLVASRLTLLLVEGRSEPFDIAIAGSDRLPNSATQRQQESARACPLPPGTVLLGIHLILPDLAVRRSIFGSARQWTVNSMNGHTNGKAHSGVQVRTLDSMP